MKYYLNENTTPLAFHTFVKWVSLPLGILKTFGELGMLSRSYAPSDWVVMDQVVMLVDLVLLVVTLVGLIRMAGFGWMALMAHLALGVGYSLVVVGLVSQYNAPDAMSMAVSNLFVSLVYSGLVGLYYMKRRYLFFPETIPAELTLAQEREERSAAPVERVAPDAPTSPVAYCRHCGQKLLPDSVFCSGCGARIDGDKAE